MGLDALAREGWSIEGVARSTSRNCMRRRILVIDHDDDVRNIVCEHLLQLGFSVARENNGMSGLVRIAQDKTLSPFDGLVLELDLPILGGMAILQEMRERHPEIRVLVTAPPGQINRLRDAMNLGAREYLVKPFDAELFLRKCRRTFWDDVGAT